MREKLTTDSSVKDLVGTQYVFTEVLPVGDDFELFKKVYKIKIDRDQLPRNFIISAQGELLKDFSMNVDLAAVLQEGIEKTGGLKGAAGYQERLKKAMAELDDVKAKLESSPDALEPISAILELDGTHGKQMPEVRKETKRILSALEKKPEQKALLTQARMLESAAELAAEKRTNKAIEMYRTIIEKFPDTPGAKAAADEIAKLESATQADPAEEGESDKDESDKGQADEKGTNEKKSDKSKSKGGVEL
ncbi:MAG: hypothetical protein DCC68_12805 [Planctomycetota bacterium]|nr:MAG: hypothetical protein DCC68_12805 [Planctomycetota bacterium]